MPRCFSWICILGLALVAGSARGAADVLLTGISDSDGSPGIGDTNGYKNRNFEIWIGPDRVRSSAESFTTILRLDQKRLYTIDPARMVYAVEELQIHGDLLQRPQANPFPLGPEAEEIMRPRLSLVQTAETRKIAQWSTRRFDGSVQSQLRAGRYRLSWWIAQDVKIEDFAYRQLILLMNPELKSLLEIPGTPILREMVAQTPDFEIKSKIAVERIDTRDAPAGTYDPPAGYRQIPLAELMGWPTNP